MIRSGARRVGPAALGRAAAAYKAVDLVRLRDRARGDGDPGLRRQRVVPRRRAAAQPEAPARRNRLVIHSRPCVIAPLIACLCPPRRTGTRKSDWRVIRTLLPYLWAYKVRVIAAVAALIGAKVANVGVPILLKEIVDSLDQIDGDARGAAGAARRLRGAAAVHDGVHRAARVPVRQGDAARGAHHRARGLPPPARAVAALPPRAADRRPHPRRRARHARDHDADQLHAVLDPAHAGRDRAGVGDPDRPLRLDVHRHHRERAHALRHLHGADHRMADGLPPDDERARLQGQHARDRQPAQLRDRQVLRQRGVRGAALRREHAALGAAPRCEPDVAVAAQRHAEHDHRLRGDADHVAGDGRCGQQGR